MNYRSNRFERNLIIVCALNYIMLDKTLYEMT